MSGELNFGDKLGGVLTKNPGQCIASGQHTTIDADDTVATGLANVLAAVAVFDGAPVAGATIVQCEVSTGGNIKIKTFKPTAAGDTAPVAATTFSIKVNWIAIGTP